MKIKLNKQTHCVITPAVTRDLSEVTIARIVDLPLEKKVRVFVRELGRPIDLPSLSGENYGDWKDKDVADALKSVMDAS